MRSKETPTASTLGVVFAWAALVAVAVCVRMFHLDARGFWGDEFITLETVRRPLGELIVTRAAMGHFATYFLIVKGWVAWAGESECMLRLPSVAFGVAMLPLVWGFARRRWGAEAAWWAVVFLVVHQRAIWASREARPYALEMLAVAGAFQALVPALETNRARWWGLYAAWTALGVLTHGAYAFIVLGQVVVVGVWFARGKRWRSPSALGWGATVGVLLIGVAAAYAWLCRHASTQIEVRFVEWAPRGWSLTKWRQGVINLFFGDSDAADIGSGVKYVALPIIAAMIALAWRGRGRLRRRCDATLLQAPVFALTLAWTFSILICMGGVSAVWRNILRNVRYVTPGLAGAAVLMGVAVASRRTRRGRWLAAGLCLLPLIVIEARYETQPGEQVRECIRYVATQRRPGEVVLFCTDERASLMAEFYGLGIEPVRVSSRETDRAVLARQLDATVAGAPSFWLLHYTNKGKRTETPIRETIAEWGRGRCRRTDLELNRARAYRYECDIRNAEYGMEKPRMETDEH